MQKKHYISIAFYNLKLNVHQIKLNLHSKIANFNFKYRTVNCLTSIASCSYIC